MARASAKCEKKKSKNQKPAAPKRREWTPKVVTPKKKRAPGKITPEELDRQKAKKTLADEKGGSRSKGIDLESQKNMFLTMDVESLKGWDETFMTTEELVAKLCLGEMAPESARRLALKKRPVSFAAVKELKRLLDWDPKKHKNLADVCPQDLWLGIIERALERGRQLILQEFGIAFKEYRKWCADKAAAKTIVAAMVSSEDMGKLIELKVHLPRKNVPSPAPAPEEVSAEPSVEQIEREAAVETLLDLCAIRGCDDSVADGGYQIVEQDGEPIVAGLCAGHVAKVRRLNPAALFLSRDEADGRLAGHLRDDEELALFMASIVPTK